MRRVIRGLYRVTSASIIAGVILFVARFLLVPILGFASGLVAAVGIWLLMFAALSTCALVALVLINRFHRGEWYFGLVSMSEPKSSRHRDIGGVCNARASKEHHARGFEQ
jgi:hypothetical protein